MTCPSSLVLVLKNIVQPFPSFCVKLVTCYENITYFTLTNTSERSNQRFNISKDHI